MIAQLGPQVAGSEATETLSTDSNTQLRLAKGATVRVRITHGKMVYDKLMSREWEGTVKAIAYWKPGQKKYDGTPAPIGKMRSILLDGTPSTRESRYCHKCGREITNNISVLVGYGPICSDDLGIPRPNVLTAEMIDSVRASVTKNFRREIWCNIDQTQIEVLDISDEAREAQVQEAAARAKFDVRFTVTDEEILVQTWPEHRLRARSVQGWRWDGDNKIWRYPKDATIARQLKDAFEGLNRRGQPEFLALIREAPDTEAAQAIKTRDDLPPLPHVDIEGWMHQRQAFYFARELPAAGLFMDMGTGKTLVAIALILDDYHKRKDSSAAYRALVVCPKKVMASDRTWSKNVNKHAKGKLTVIEALPQAGWTRKDRIRALFGDLDTVRGPAVAVINYEMLDDEEVCDMLLKHGWHMLILDESHKTKATDGKRARACWKLGAKIRRRLLLTGTPMPHSPLDIWSQYKTADLNIYGGSVTRFKQRYCLLGGYTGRDIVGWQNEAELNSRMYSIAYRVTDDVLDLPEQRHEDVPVTLSPRALKLAHELEEDMRALADEAIQNKEDGTGITTVTNVLVKLLRLQQVTSGFLPDDAGNTHRIDTGKADALAEILDEIQAPKIDSHGRRVPGETVVVFCKFRHDLDVIKEVCERKASSTGHEPFVFAELSGRKDELEKWQNGHADVLGVQIQAGGAGIDLTRAHYCVYYSVGYSLGDYLQSVKRLHRPGQEKPVLYYHLVATDTIDVEVYSALIKKQSVVNRILGYNAEEDDGNEPA